MKKPLVIVLMAFLCISAGCVKGAIEDEMRSLMKNQWSAKGSELRNNLCGFPCNAALNMRSMKVSLSPESGSRHASGTVDISAESDLFTCRGVIFFTYSTVYMGGHGSGGSEIAIGIMRRENDVPAEISAAAQAKPLKIGEKIRGALSASGERLPDGSYADHYYIDLQGEDPAIRIEIRSEVKGLPVQGSLYKNGKLVPGMASDYGMRFKPGRLFLLVTAGTKSGGYTILAENSSASERSMLKQAEY